LKTDNKAIAVVNVDSTRPLTFSDENKEILHRALAGALDLLADILYVTREGAPIPAAPNSVRRRHGP
jgi:hypothetical protein